MPEAPLTPTEHNFLQGSQINFRVSDYQVIRLSGYRVKGYRAKGYRQTGLISGFPKLPKIA